MIRLFIKLAIAALIANAVWRVGSEYLTYYRFKDDVRNAATFQRGSNDDLRERIEQMAVNFDIPLDDDDLSIAIDQDKTVSRSVIELKYVKPIEVFPGFLYGWPFSLQVDTVYSKRF